MKALVNQEKNFMIVKKEITKYDESHRIVTFDAEKNGKYVQKVVRPEIAGKEKLAETYYIARKVELDRLIEELKQGDISPIKLYMEYFHMNLQDLANRMNISQSKLNKHFTLEGFKNLKISDLSKYAVIFDIGAAEFFQILNIKDDIKIESNMFHDRLLQEFTIKTVKSKK
jgi:hypothetical protein